MKFVKMHGAGNDYIFVGGKGIENLSALAKEMSDRHFGVGGDGVVFLFPSEVADVKMRMFNADGSEGAMCGNAVRCIASLIGKKRVTVETESGIKTVLGGGELYTVDMGVPQVSNPLELEVRGEKLSCYPVSMGNPHCVIFVRDVNDVDIELGKDINCDPHFKGGVNVEFVSGGGETLFMRVWERGSGETLSCGTGACAAVAAATKAGICKQGAETEVRLLGGQLKVKYNGNIFLTGNAVKIYEGEYYDKIHICDRRCSQRAR